ncbi:right-handed parallel beta-helix repeat-containing protein [Paenibacillus dakarensis]|uniref:right-handed parallel beta-helix repeat-containing protein n=1 Tax=Paenibacillus dakarensis TaxID=1527293 RepID=UPI0006D5AA22|nr:NosD domain-containing protein [Paenibacillus dakarensis]
MQSYILKRTVLRAFFIITVLLLALPRLPGTARAEEPEPIPLQPIIDQAAPQGVLKLEETSYSGPVIIDKPLTLISDRGKIVNDSSSPALTISAEGVTVKGLTIVQLHRDASIPAVLVKSDDNKLQQLTIKTLGSGIQLRKADGNLLQDHVIVGGKMTGQNPSTVLRGNGIDLYESNRNTISGNRIDLMQDGIYVEGGSSSTVRDNLVIRSRYGYHFMFTKKLLLEGNEGVSNITGAMIMSVSAAEVLGNTFEKQSSNVNSQGLLLYDVQQSLVEDNTVKGNRVGLFVQLSGDNQLSGNDIAGNFIGLQLLDSKENLITGNTFQANVVPAQSVGSSGNTADRNYWDSASVLDEDGDGFSDLPYEVNPFFLQVTGAVPAFQLLFDSPGMPVLEELFHTHTGDWLKDTSPLLQPAGTAPENKDGAADGSIAAVSAFLLSLGLLSIIHFRRVKR